MLHLAGPIAELTRDETAELLRSARATGSLDAAEFTRWW